MPRIDNTNIDRDESTVGKRIIGWLLFPFSLFPLIALLTYDWRSISFNRTPPLASTNWIGPIGDWFAYFGYSLLGLAVWIIPVICTAYGMRLISGFKFRGWMRLLWTSGILASAACLLHILQAHAPGIAALRETFACMDSGGAIGYFFAGKVLSPLISDIGSSVLLTVLLFVSIVGSVGAGNIARFFTFIARWALAKDQIGNQNEAAAGTPEYEQAKQDLENAKAVREAAKREKEAEKEAAIRRMRETDKGVARPAKSNAAPARPKREASVQEKKMEDAEKNSAPDTGKGPYILPPIDLLNPLKESSADHSDVGTTSQRLIDTLKIFGIDATLSYTVQGPVVTKYAIMLAPGTKYSVVTNIADNIKGALHAISLRIETPIPGEECIGIEVPNRKPAGITFREIFESDAWKNNKAELPLLFGKRADGRELVSDLASMPHMLVAGATGQGKSVCLNSLINGLLMTRTPEQLKLIMVDPKCVEFNQYAKIPHLLVPVITDNKKVVYSLRWAVAEMEKRLKLFARAKVRNIYDFNHRSRLAQTNMFGDDEAIDPDMPLTVPYIVVIIDEAADLIGECGKEVNPNIQRITQKARAAGIHLILATQRPDAKIITGTIKANIPGRVAFKTASSVDSRTILDDTGAENLIGRGDMLFKGKDGLLIRAQGAWIADDEIARITAFIEEHSSVQFDETFAKKLGRVKEADIDDPFKDNEDDPDNQVGNAGAEQKAEEKALVKASAEADDYKKAIECIINTNRASTSHFQRTLGWGYNRAAKVLDKLAANGIVSNPQGMGPRQITMDQAQLIALLNDGANANGEEGENQETETTEVAEAGEDPLFDVDPTEDSAEVSDDELDL